MRYRRRKRIHNDPTPSATGQMMNLSLFIMLLAFFIVLNSISTFKDEKAAKVRQSIEKTFALKVTRDSTSNSMAVGKAKSVNEGNAFERLEVLFQSQLSGFKTTKDSSRGTMMVEVPFDVFEKAVNALDQQDLTKTPSRSEARENFFLPTLSSIMQANINGAPTRLEIYLNVLNNPATIQNEEPREMNKLINIMGEFSTKLSDQNIPNKLLNIGVAQGNPKNVTLVFRKYKAFSPVKKGDNG